MADNQLKYVIDGDASGLTNAVGQANKALTGLKVGSNQATNALTNLSRVAQDAPFGFIGIANNIDPLIASFTSLKKETGSVGGAFKALGASLAGGGGLVLFTGLASAALTLFGDKLFSSGKSASSANKELLIYKDTVEGVANEIGKDAAKVTTLVSALENGNLTVKQRAKALNDLKNINVEFFASLKDEEGVVKGLQAAYDGYINRLKEIGRQKAIENQLTKLFDKKLELELRLDPKFSAATSQETTKEIGRLRKRLNELGGALSVEELSKVWDVQADGSVRVNDTLKERERLQKQIKELEQGSNVLIFDKGGQLQRQIEQIDLQIQGLTKIQDVTGNFDITEQKITSEKEKQNKKIEKQISLYEQLKRSLPQIRNAASEVGKGPEIGNTAIKPRPIEGFTDKNASAEAESIRNYYTTLEAAIEESNKIVKDGIVNGIIGIADAFGSALATGGIGDALAAAGESLLKIMGTVLQEVGKQMIIASELVQGLKIALKTLFTNPIAGVAVGVGLVALGGLLKNIQLAKVPAFAEGGIVSGPTLGLVGEAGREAIIPLDRIGEVLGSVGGAQSVFVTGQLSGETIYLQQQRTANRRGRFV